MSTIWQPFQVGAPILLVCVVFPNCCSVDFDFSTCSLFNKRFNSLLGACSLFGAPLALSEWFYVVCAAHLMEIVVIVLVVCAIGCSLSPSHGGKVCACVFRSRRSLIS